MLFCIINLDIRRLLQIYLKKKYADCTIVIYSEKQIFSYKYAIYSLLDHKDFVILECINRLLELGYSSNEIQLSGDDCDIELIENKISRLNIICEQWGDDFKEKNASFQPENHLPCVIYTSKFSGGLIDVISSIYYGNKTYDHGIFEEGCTPFKFDDSYLWNSIQIKEYGDEFIVKRVCPIDTSIHWTEFFLIEITSPGNIMIQPFHY